MVGSWPAPFGQRPVLRPFWRGEVDEDDPTVAAALAAAARVAMDEQRACGLDEIMGGEVFAPDFLHHIPPRLSGLATLEPRDLKGGYDRIGRYRIVGDLAAPNGTGHAKAFRRERAVEAGLVKASVVSPFTIAMAFERDPALAGQRDNLIAIVDREVAELVDAGCREIQFDAPSEAVSAVRDARGVDELAAWLAPSLRAVAGVTRTVHFCLGDVGRRPATQRQNLHALLPLVRALDGLVERVHVECSYAGQWEERSLLAEVPASMQVIAGIADVKSAPASVEVLRSRIDALLEVMPAERLAVSTSCGCGRVPHDDAIRLMLNLVRAARGQPG